MTRSPRSVQARARRLAELVPAMAFLASSIAADLVAIGGHGVARIWAVLPLGPIGGSWIDIEIASTGLFLVGLALLRSKQDGYWLALGALLGAVVLQGVNAHPIGVAFAAGAAAVLVLSRDRYRVEGGGSLLAGRLVVAGAMAAAAGWMMDAGGALAAGGSRWAAALLLVARVAAVGAAAAALAPSADRRSAKAVAAARSALRAKGRGALFPYALDPPVEAFASHDGRAVLAYARAGRVAVALGDPAGPVGAARQGFREWVHHYSALDWVPAIYQASERLATRLRTDGWFGCRIGSEAIIDPQAFDLAASRLANVRHTVTRSRRGGLEVVTWRPGVEPAPSRCSAAGLAALDAEWRRNAGLAIGFTVGRFDMDKLHGALVAVAVDRSGSPAAFVLLRPTGADRGWMLDLIRRRQGAVPGAVEACLVAAIEALAGAGIDRLSLGLVPLGGPPASRDGATERLLALAGRVMRPLYDVEGLAFFKDKFGATWVPRYLVVPRWWDAPSALLALLRLHLGVSWRHLAIGLQRLDGIATRGERRRGSTG